MRKDAGKEEVAHIPSHLALAKKLLRLRYLVAILMIEVNSRRVHLSHFAHVKAFRFDVGVRCAHKHGARGVRCVRSPEVATPTHR